MTTASCFTLQHLQIVEVDHVERIQHPFVVGDAEQVGLSVVVVIHRRGRVTTHDDDGIVSSSMCLDVSRDAAKVGLGMPLVLNGEGPRSLCLPG